ncbi:unknown [[Mannheimia] succiniciproducens MBEL55E]|uniref:Uncharacterized protein n=1 Tax=Mannheimia succiniciproducens (strain KCTC 0769BP / MBEL55E) TaxID=221988 RepID=Q65VT9_MANSM|nr:unknown [[Mannheimia] succiniciproducens MBEL55E]
MDKTNVLFYVIKKIAQKRPHFFLFLSLKIDNIANKSNYYFLC